MPINRLEADCDTAIVGGGPAGLSAAIVLSRARRRVILFDHGQPRNYAARGIHGYLGHEGIAPRELRERGRREAASFGAVFVDDEVVAARCLRDEAQRLNRFQLDTSARSYIARTVLLATGVVDQLPAVPHLKDFYGTSVHHCPYCDGWEHRDQHLAALGDGHAAVGLALELRIWSPHVTLCSNGERLTEKDKQRLADMGIPYCEDKVARLSGADGRLAEVVFENEPPLECDALFFKADKVQRSPLARTLGCARDENDMARTEKKQGTGVPGLFVAGDADGDVQFAIVAAAEGAIAATAINEALQLDEQTWTRR